MTGSLWYHPDKYAQTEIERRFLLAKLPSDVNTGSFVRITDHYLAGTRLRLRRMASPADETVALKLAQKYQGDGQPDDSTMITTIYLNEAEYALLAKLGGASLVKRRYRYRVDVYLYSLDVFEGQLDGLVMLEIEGRPGLDIGKLPVPEIAIREVTGDPFFDGGSLSIVSLEDFQARLKSETG